jgi:hypothetical protein
VFRVKRNADGTIDRFKVRLVTKGFNQRPGLDYKETFSPVVKQVTIRSVLTIAKGFNQRPHYVYRLNKAIYGLKRAPRAWYSTLRGAILEFGFMNSRADSSLFIYKTTSATCYFLEYVDDLVITGNDLIFVSSIIDQLSIRFSVKDMGQLHFFLGMEVIPTTTGLFLSQHKYIRDVLTKLNMHGAKVKSLMT